MPFESLPIEIHRLIFSFLGDYADMFCLSLVDLYFWRIGRQELKQEILSGLCPLADKALICLGSDSSANSLDIPAGLLTADELEELQGGLDSDDDEDSCMWVSCGSDRPVSLYELAQERYDYSAQAPWFTYYWPNIYFHFRTCGRDITFLSKFAEENLKAFPEPERSQVLALAAPKLEEFYPKSKKWVLRNLTTREFVTADAIAQKPGFIEGLQIKFLGFGEAVLSKICWSSNPDSTLKCELPLHRGAWAGHRLDIVTTEKFQMESGEGGTDKWKDVSDEVTTELGAIWESGYGKDWVNEKLKWEERLSRGSILSVTLKIDS